MVWAGLCAAAILLANCSQATTVMWMVCTQTPLATVQASEEAPVATFLRTWVKGRQQKMVWNLCSPELQKEVRQKQQLHRAVVRILVPAVWQLPTHSLSARLKHSSFLPMFWNRLAATGTGPTSPPRVTEVWRGFWGLATLSEWVTLLLGPLPKASVQDRLPHSLSAPLVAVLGTKWRWIPRLEPTVLGSPVSGCRYRPRGSVYPPCRCCLCWSLPRPQVLLPRSSHHRRLQPKAAWGRRGWIEPSPGSLARVLATTPVPRNPPVPARKHALALLINEPTLLTCKLGWTNSQWERQKKVDVGQKNLFRCCRYYWLCVVAYDEIDAILCTLLWNQCLEIFFPVHPPYSSHLPRRSLVLIESSWIAAS